MDIEKLIEQLEAWNEQHLSVVCGSGHFACDYLCENEDCIVVQAATALSTLQAENEKLRAELEYEEEHANAYYEECGQWEAENEKLRSEAEGMRSNWYKSVEELRKVRVELERVKRERDAAVESIPHECKTCMYHMVFFNGCTPDHDCTNPDGGCSNNYDRWEWRGRKEG